MSLILPFLILVGCKGFDWRTIPSTKKVEVTELVITNKVGIIYTNEDEATTYTPRPGVQKAVEVAKPVVTSIIPPPWNVLAELGFTFLTGATGMHVVHKVRRKKEVSK